MFINCYNCNNIKVNVENATLSDIYQKNPRQNSILGWFIQNSKVTFNNIRILNSGGKNTAVLYTSDYSVVHISNLEIDTFISETPSEMFIYSFENKNEGIVLDLERIELNNIISQGVLFTVYNGKVHLSNSKIKNAHVCHKENTCKSIKDDNYIVEQIGISVLNSKSELLITNTIFENIYGESGFVSSIEDYITINNSLFLNCEFSNGLFKINRERLGIYTINYTNFTNIISESGSIIHIENLDEASPTIVTINNSNFVNIKANRYGGILYSLSKHINDRVSFNDCNFKGSKASIGNILYVIDKDSEPYISNMDDLKKIKGNIATNPTKIKLNYILDTIELYSGDKLPDNIACKSYYFIYNLFIIKYM
ncbi:hypothetical protein BCR36DRAFT_111736 [Piromyces finnis]|uniref:Right handed beta helix domain-containing protein n=1 Tax=Piromyces finnis TaxID=1754191 RepID=A0A1Y1VJZ7_9FUNG|nr:hypothetical protein BCR36DRAFT_111736 [Piromyces finnis]|eukprot:ORX58413.1 hypothetical protein BCR36DRAFT_111736 [Piromyces finnis]